MSRLRQRLFETYDAHYLRGNALLKETLSDEAYRSRMREFEAGFGSIVAKLHPGSEVLDIGCGAGFFLYWLAVTRGDQYRLTGIDISEPMLEIGRRFLPESIRLVIQDTLAFLTSNVGRFGGIFCTDVLEHIEGEDSLLKLVEASRAALVPGGWFTCRVPNMANLVSPQLRYIDLTHKRGFTTLSLLQLLECGGLSDCRIIKRKPADVGQALRLSVEHLLHRIVYRVCGVGNERHFTRVLVAAGRA